MERTVVMCDTKKVNFAVIHFRVGNGNMKIAKMMAGHVSWVPAEHNGSIRSEYRLDPLSARSREVPRILWRMDKVVQGNLHGLDPFTTMTFPWKLGYCCGYAGAYSFHGWLCPGQEWDQAKLKTIPYSRTISSCRSLVKSCIRERKMFSHSNFGILSPEVNDDEGKGT